MIDFIVSLLWNACRRMRQRGEMNDCIHAVDTSRPIDLFFQIANLDLLNALYPRHAPAVHSDDSIFPIQQMRNEMPAEKPVAPVTRMVRTKHPFTCQSVQLGGMR